MPVTAADAPALPAAGLVVAPVLDWPPLLVGAQPASVDKQKAIEHARSKRYRGNRTAGTCFESITQSCG
jgi:hypothetical protein